MATFRGPFSCLVSFYFQSSTHLALTPYAPLPRGCCVEACARFAGTWINSVLPGRLASLLFEPFQQLGQFLAQKIFKAVGDLFHEFDAGLALGD